MPAHPNRQANAAEFIDHVQELAGADVHRLVELEFDRPDVVRVLRAQQLHAATGRPRALARARQVSLEPFLTPDPLHPLVIDAPAIKPQPSVDKPPAPAHGYDCEASAPRCLPVVQGAAGYCGVDLSTGMHAAGKSGIDPAEPRRSSC